MSTQEMTVAAAEEVMSNPDFIVCTPPTPFWVWFPWLVMLVFALLVVVLGILSVIHSRKQSSQWPLATKLLLLMGIWAQVHGLMMFAQCAMYKFFSVPILGLGPASVAMVSHGLSQSLLPVSVALSIGLVALLFLTVSAFLRRRTGLGNRA